MQTTQDQVKRVERLKTMEAARIAPMAVYLASERSQDVFSGDPI